VSPIFVLSSDIPWTPLVGSEVEFDAPLAFPSFSVIVDWLSQSSAGAGTKTEFAAVAQLAPVAMIGFVAVVPVEDVSEDEDEDEEPEDPVPESEVVANGFEGSPEPEDDEDEEDPVLVPLLVLVPEELLVELELEVADVVLAQGPGSAGKSLTFWSSTTLLISGSTTPV
jgi:hypothetical protein